VEGKDAHKTQGREQEKGKVQVEVNIAAHIAKRSLYKKVIRKT